jgi:hypothetical protein
MSARAETQPEHLTAETARWATPASELAGIEIGGRADYHADGWALIDDPFTAALELAGSVADAARDAGKPLPAAWWPPSAGPAPR